MKRLVPISMAIGWLASATTANAQLSAAAPEALAVGDWKLTPVFEARTQVQGRADLDEADRAMVFERVRLGIAAQYDLIDGRIVLEDARAFDFDSGPFVSGPSAVATTGIYEAWMQVSLRASAATFVRVGKQPVTWGEGRLLGASDASPAGRSIYAIRGRWGLADGGVELLAAALDDVSPSGVVASTVLYGELLAVRGDWAFDPLLGLELDAFARIAQVNPTDPATNLGGSVEGQTYVGSLYLHGEGQSWSWGAEGAYELGYASSYSASREAWATAGHVEKVFELVVWRPALRLGASYATGDSGGLRYRAFDSLLPDTHVWRGALDLFAWSNEAEASARVSVVPCFGTMAQVEYRNALLAVPTGYWRSDYFVAVGAAPGNTDRNLGHEIDARLGWAPWASLDLTAGYSLFVLEGGAKAILATSYPASVAGAAHMASVQAKVTF